MGEFGVGQPVRRQEDARLLKGEGRYHDDIVLENQAYAAVVRSPHPHARIRGIDVRAAAAVPGVLAVLTGAEADGADGVGPVPIRQMIKNRDGSDSGARPRALLRADAVRFVGDPVALVVAESRRAARDAAERVTVDYEPLAAVVDPVEAMTPGAPQIWAHAANNVCVDWMQGDAAAVEKAFAAADHVTRIDLVNNRIVVVSMDPRGANGVYDAAADSYTLYTDNQVVHVARDDLAVALNVPKDKVRVISPDVGGAFGMKAVLYPEQVLVLWAARRLGRPVKWASDRGEAFLCDTQGRDHRTHAELALDRNGRFLGLRVRTVANLGACAASSAAPRTPCLGGGKLLTGVYDIPAAMAEAKVVFTNTAPVTAYRGAGRPETAYVIERLVDKAAREMRIDPAALRRRNFIPPSAMPFTNAVGATYDSGNFRQNLDDVLELADWAGAARRRAKAAQAGKLRGIGLCTYIEATAAAPADQARIAFAPDAGIRVFVGTNTNGQGHVTAYMQYLSEALGVPFESIQVFQGDTGTSGPSGGTGGSRSMMAGGVALHHGVRQIVEKGKRIAAHLLEAAAIDMEFSAGRFIVAGTDRGLSLQDVARAAQDAARLPPGEEPGLDSVGVAGVAEGAYPNGAHVCEVEVDPETGEARIVAYSVVDDFGTVVNPLLVEGQVHGGIAQGAGQALMEHCLYDRDSGQLLTGSLMDYCLPRAVDFPFFRFDFNEVPCTTNPLGIKGAGEAGTTGALAAVVNALVDALSPYGLVDVDMPATPERLWRLIAAHRK